MRFFNLVIAGVAIAGLWACGSGSTENGSSHAASTAVACGTTLGGPCCPQDDGVFFECTGPGLFCSSVADNTGTCQACGGEGQTCCDGSSCSVGFCIGDNGQISMNGNAGTCLTSPPPAGSLPPPPPGCGYSGERCCNDTDLGNGTPSNPGSLCFDSTGNLGFTCTADSLGGTCPPGNNRPPPATLPTPLCGNSIGQACCVVGQVNVPGTAANPGTLCFAGDLTCVADNSGGTCQQVGPCGGVGQPCCDGTDAPACNTGFCIFNGAISTFGTCLTSPLPPAPVVPCGGSGQRCCSYSGAGTPSDPGFLCQDPTKPAGNMLENCIADALGGTCP